MTHRTPLIILFVLAALSLGLIACSDDNPATPDDSFAIEITVLDAQGQPLADRPVLVLPLLPPGILQDGRRAAKAAVQIPFTLSENCFVDVEIRDVAGATVRRLLTDYEAAAGRHVVVWNGRDDEGVDRHTGWYAAMLTCRDPSTGEVLFTDSRGMLMVLMDFDQTDFRTDANGKLSITDRRVVPGFWDLPEMRFTDENGDVIGLYTFTRWTQIRAAGRRIDFEAIDGRQSLILQQAPPPVGGPGGVTAAVISSRLAPPSDGSFELGDPRPNPFN